MLFSELAKRVAEKYPEVKAVYPMDCELSNIELYDPNGAVPPVDTLNIYTARQISEDMTLPLCLMGAISLVHVRFGILTPSVRPSSAENSAYSALTASRSTPCAAFCAQTAAAHMAQKSVGMPLSSSCMRSLARSARHGSTGSD